MYYFSQPIGVFNFFNIDCKAAAITDAKLKMSDIPCAVLICSLMYQRYSEFSAALMDNWQKYLLHKKDEKVR